MWLVVLVHHVDADPRGGEKQDTLNVLGVYETLNAAKRYGFACELEYNLLNANDIDTPEMNAYAEAVLADDRLRIPDLREKMLGDAEWGLQASGYRLLVQKVKVYTVEKTALADTAIRVRLASFKE